MFNTILVPTDGSPLSDKAVRAAIEFAKLNHGKLIVMTVIEPYPATVMGDAIMLPDLEEYEQQKNELAKQQVQKIADAAKLQGLSCEMRVSVSYSPSDEIIKAAEETKCDVIFMASHGRRGLNKLFLGSETQRVLTHSNTPVMVLR